MNKHDIYLYKATAARSDSHRLLYRAAADYCRRFDRAFVTFPLSKAEQGKPYFKEYPWLHFSISHSGEYWLCAISQQELGLDVERIRTVDAVKLSRRFFHPKEHDYLRAHPEDFFLLWTAKESYVKYTGRGIAGSFGDFSAVEDGKLSDSINGVLLRHLPLEENYALCLCTPTLQSLHWIDHF